MADEMEFIEQGLQRSQIDEFFAEELARAGYGGMELAPTPMGMQIVLKAEKPGMVIGKGGKNIRKITTQLEERFDLEDPQIDVQEVDEPDLNAQIVADRLANALERGWYFRKAGHTTIDRIMEAGALGAEIVLSGKVTGNRGRVEKFNRGYIKHNGEPAEEIVDHGKGVAVMKLGTIGVSVKIIPPEAKLPDDFEIHEDADIEDLIVEEEEASEELEELLEGEDEEVEAGGPEGEVPADAAETDAADEAAVEEIVEEDIEVEEGASETSPPDTDADVEEDLDELAADVEAEAEDVDTEDFDELESDAEETAEELLEEMESEEESEEGEE
ncbi:30S ribosomal protein S3 [Halobacterium noricense]|uniref:30S ribosomal protein S3 n=1 Tax=Halobacterium noricense TaxID=223182 RepID=UPI001E5B13D5|nr:30S ribosomal protein S3 [Halobacterium noricense]UHH24676.1 30S ribosomal protein S3 [Halobacterium noricense]